MTDRAALVTLDWVFDDHIDSVVETGTPLLALFSATTWCIPCRQFEPHWLKSQEMLPNHFFVKVDMGERPEDAGSHWATGRFGIRGVPSVKLFDDDGVRDIKVPQGVISFVREVNGG